MKGNTTTTFRLGALAMVFFAAISMVGCSGDDGAIGPNGADGTNGTNGTDGVGFADATANGSIVLIVDGTRPDGIAFKDTVTFAYAPSELYYSRLYRSESETDVNNDNYVELQRYQSWDGTHGSGRIYSYSEAWLDGTFETRYFNLQPQNAIVKFPAEHKYFYLSMNVNYRYYNGEGGAATETNVTGVTLDYKRPIGTDGAFTYKASFTVPADYNSTGYDLKVTAVADVTVYESIGNSEGDGGRVGNAGRAATSTVKSVEKASMQSIK